jgi:membrane protein implicated in regulation of membrane protease activity
MAGGWVRLSKAYSPGRSPAKGWTIVDYRPLPESLLGQVAVVVERIEAFGTGVVRTRDGQLWTASNVLGDEVPKGRLVRIVGTGTILRVEPLSG